MMKSRLKHKHDHNKTKHTKIYNVYSYHKHL